MVEKTYAQVENEKTSYCLCTSCADCPFHYMNGSMIECTEPTVEDFAQNFEIKIVETPKEIKFPCKMYVYKHPRIKEVTIKGYSKSKKHLVDEDGELWNLESDHIYPSMDELKTWLVLLFESDIKSNEHAIKVAENNIQIARYRIQQVATANLDTKFVDRFQFDFDKGDI